MTDPYYEADGVTLYHGDTLHILPTLPDASVDAIVTDPPYELGFMGKTWDNAGIAYNPTMWAEALRVLKPGGHLVAFGGTRTYHRMTCAIEDAGFEVRDSLMWLYGSGFPKSHNIGKAIDKAAGAEREVVGHRPPSGSPAVGAPDSSGSHIWSGNLTGPPATPEAAQWDGWGTALKPAYEPIVLARKPLVGTVAANVLQFGTGGLNVDGCRIGTDGGTTRSGQAPYELDEQGKEIRGTNWARTGHGVDAIAAGRWPANVTLDPHAAHQVDRQSGVSTSKSGGVAGWQDAYVGGTYSPIPRTGHNDTGGASRFYYVAKADASERPGVDGVVHPTVKPVDLMQWLVRLVTPPGGLVLEPFAGSGTTAEACLVEGMRCIAIEREATYLPLIVQRVTKPIEVTLL